MADMFQYIICVGSRFYGAFLLKSSTSFNTSYVSVQEMISNSDNNSAYAFQYIICVGSSFGTLSPYGRLWQFQYIICVGSRSQYYR